MIKKSTLYFLAGACASGAFAQEPEQPLPAGPIIARMQNFAKWQIDYSYALDKNKPAEAVATPPLSKQEQELQKGRQLPPRRVIVTRTRPFWNATTLDTDRKKTEQWFDGRNHFLQLPDGSPPAMVPGEFLKVNFPYLTDFSKVDFPDMEWVTAPTYIGTQKVGSALCYVFKQSSAPESCIVWIDTENHFPIRWQRGDEIRQIKLLDTPSQAITFPESLGKYKLELQLLNKIDTLTDPPPKVKNKFRPKG